jgi:hypothetical protein
VTLELPPLDATALLAVLNRHDVEYVVIGGFALMAHDATRATKDIDIVPDPDPRNLDRLWDALTELESTPLGIGDFEAREAPLEWARENLGFGGNWLLATTAGRVDVLQYVSGVDDYSQLRTNAVDIINPDAGRIWFAGKADLIAMKRAAGRPQDLLDIERLERSGDPLTGY